MINGVNISIKPHLQVNYGYTLQIIKLIEVEYVMPVLRFHHLENVNSNGKRVLVYHKLVTMPNEKMVDIILLVDNNLRGVTGHNNLPSTGLYMLGRGIA